MPPSRIPSETHKMDGSVHQPHDRKVAPIVMPGPNRIAVATANPGRGAANTTNGSYAGT